ncbi:MAG: hypothetical protein ISS49_16340 [Anaerolineae bacterium]|nr:hypothetical protein [Anaerolineae bacterium]
MSPKRWVFDPNSGGVKIEEAVKRRIEERIRRYAETCFAGRYTRLDIRFRGQFCYVDAYTEPEPPGPDWPPPYWTESREEYLERLRNTPTHLFRLRHFGNEDSWGLAFYSYAHDRYELSVFPSGEFFGLPEDAFQIAAEFHL